MPSKQSEDKDAPKRPLSSYNLFFLLERKRIIEGTDQESSPVTREQVRTVAIEHSKKGRRKHRKTHGKISFKVCIRMKQQRHRLRRMYVLIHRYHHYLCLCCRTWLEHSRVDGKTWKSLVKKSLKTKPRRSGMNTNSN